MSKIKLKCGIEMTPLMAASYMDDVLREKLHGFEYNNEQEFFNAYCHEHKKVFKETFILDLSNPTI
jgi:hypothetical protein